MRRNKHRTISDNKDFTSTSRAVLRQQKIAYKKSFTDGEGNSITPCKWASKVVNGEPVFPIAYPLPKGSTWNFKHGVRRLPNGYKRWRLHDEF